MNPDFGIVLYLLAFKYLVTLNCVTLRHPGKRSSVEGLSTEISDTGLPTFLSTLQRTKGFLISTVSKFDSR